MATTSLSALLSSAQLEGQRLRVKVPGDWSQGRSVFGGLQGALALRAMRSCVPPSLPLRTLQATLIAPTAGDLEVEAQVLRTGKNATHVEARIFEQGTLCAVLIGVFGSALASTVTVALTQEAIAAPQPLPLPFVAGVTPNFIQHFEARLLRGGLPFTGMEVNESVYEVALQDSADVSEYSVVAVADFPPPLALSHLRRPAPGSTLTWMLEFLTDTFAGASQERFRVDVQLVAARDGYTHQSATIWSSTGVPLALSRQTMLVFG